MLVGRDARRIEDTWQYLYKGAYWRRGPVTMTAIAAVDTALWDIRAKSLDVPLYQLLGGASRERVMVYAHANGKTLDETVEAVAHHLKLGYKAIRAQCGIPGMDHVYGIAKGSAPYEPAESGLPLESVWSTEGISTSCPSVFDRLRREFGYELHLLHDVHHRLTPIEAGALGKSLEPYRLFWMEDPVPAELQGVVPPHPPPHHDAARGRRGLQHHLRLPSAHRGAAHRLHPDDGDACRRDQSSSEDCGARRAASRAHRLSWRNGSQSGGDGCGAALRAQRAQLRDSGAHAAQRRDGSGVPACVHASTRAACTPAIGPGSAST